MKVGTLLRAEVLPHETGGQAVKRLPSTFHCLRLLANPESDEPLARQQKIGIPVSYHSRQGPPVDFLKVGVPVLDTDLLGCQRIFQA